MHHSGRHRVDSCRSPSPHRGDGLLFRSWETLLIHLRRSLAALLALAILCDARAGFNHRKDPLGEWTLYGSGDATVDLALDESGRFLSCSDYGVVLWDVATKSYAQSLPPGRNDRRDCQRVFRLASRWVVLMADAIWQLDDSLRWARIATIEEPRIGAASDGSKVMLALRKGSSWILRSYDGDRPISDIPPPAALASSLPAGFRLHGTDSLLLWTTTEAWLWETRSASPIRIVSGEDLPRNTQIHDVLLESRGVLWILASNAAYRRLPGDSALVRTRLMDGSETIAAQQLIQGSSSQIFASGRNSSNTGYLWIDSVWQPTNYLHSIRASDSANRTWTANGSRIASNLWTPGGGPFSGTTTNYSLFEEGAPQAILNTGFLVGAPLRDGLIVGIHANLSVAGSFQILHGDSITGSLHASEIPKRLAPFRNGFAGAIAEGILFIDSALTSATVTKLGMDGLPDTRLDRCERHPESGLVCRQFASGGIGLWDAGTWTPMRAGGTTTILATASGSIHFRDSSGTWNRCENGDCSRAVPMVRDAYPGFDGSAGTSSLPSWIDRSILRTVVDGRSCLVVLWGRDANARISVHSKATGASSEIDLGIPASMVHDIALDSSDRIWFFTEKGAISWKPADPLLLDTSVPRPVRARPTGASLAFHDGRTWVHCAGICSSGREARVHSTDGRIVWKGIVSEGSTPLPFRNPYPLFLRLAPR